MAIGRYEIKREIGRGGMASVYLGYDPRFQREVAIKVLPSQFMHDPRFLERFEQEARTIAALEHYAIVPVYDFGEENDAPFLVMRYMTGGSLRERMAAELLSLPAISEILARLAKALDRAHSKGIIHRDLKPGNVLFDEENLPYLADFGIARMAEATQTMTVVGTPGYMSPEQVQGQVKLDWRSDIYALGVMLFELLTGRQPFVAETPTGQMFMHVMEPVPDLMPLNPDLLPGTQAVVNKAMAKDRETRYQSATALAAAFQQLLSISPIAAVPPAQPVAPTIVEAETKADPIPLAAEAVLLGAADTTVVEPPPQKPLPSTRQTASSAVSTPYSSPAPPVTPTRAAKKSGGIPGWVWWLAAIVVILILIFGLRAIFGESPPVPVEPEVAAQPTEEIRVDTDMVVQSPDENPSQADPAPADPDLAEAAPAAGVEDNLIAEAAAAEETLPNLEGREIRIAVENGYLPFYYIDPDSGEAAGIDNEIWTEICRMLNCKPVFVDREWDGLMEAVGRNEFDAGASGITLTEERAEVVDFADPYMENHLRLLVRRDEERFGRIEDIVENETLLLGAQLGTYDYDTAASYLPEDRIQGFDQMSTAVQALIDGNIDAFMFFDLAGQGHQAEDANQLKLVGPALYSEELGYIFGKGSDLVEPVNEALHELRQNGFLVEQQRAFFGPDFDITNDDLEG